MNPLQQAEVNSMRLIEERLAKLDEELALMETRFQADGENEATSKPALVTDTTALKQRYTELPSLTPPAPKKTSLRPQITPEYTQTLQYAPSLQSLYSPAHHEPCYLTDIHPLPPRLSTNPRLVSDLLDAQNREKQV